jgi:hypothetical protein
MKDLKNLDRAELLEIANLFLNQTHSEGFKVAEAKDFLSDDYPCFSSVPKPTWKEDVIKYLTDKGYELPKNRLFETTA